MVGSSHKWKSHTPKPVPTDHQPSQPQQTHSSASQDSSVRGWSIWTNHQLVSKSTTTQAGSMCGLVVMVAGHSKSIRNDNNHDGERWRTQQADHLSDHQKVSYHRQTLTQKIVWASDNNDDDGGWPFQTLVCVGRSQFGWSTQ